MSLIDIKNLSVGYFLGKSNEVRALSDVSLKIEPGEFIIFFGASGCGKSTLLYTIAGLERPTGGSVLVTGINLAEMKNKELEYYRQHTIGMVFQAFHLIPSLSIAKNIMLPQIAIGGDPKKRREEAERLMKYFGVYEQRNKVPNELSGGQQQRVAICRSLINDPEIIFADEPVGNLDSKSAHDVLGLIQELNIKQKKTVILVTHDPSHLDIADRVFFMKDGKVIDTKVNKETRKITIEKPGEEAKKSNLELVSKTLATSEHMGIGGLFLEYKVKEIVSDALTGLTIEEVSGIERRVSEILKNKLSDYRDLEDYLDREYTFGGLDLNKRTAHRLTDNIRGVVEEMKTLVEADASGKKSLSYVEKLRFNLLDTFDVHVSSTEIVERIESIIRERVEGRTDRKGVQALFDTSVVQGGAGLDRRDAKRMSKHLELLLLTRYDGHVKNDKEGHSKSKKSS